MQEIIIVEGRWVFVGMVTVQDSELHLKDAWNVRVWGTGRGLGQLALSGPTSSTALDFYGDMIIPMHAVLGRITCRVAVEGKKK